MDERLTKTITSLSSWSDLAQFEENARDRNRLTAEVKAALDAQSTLLGRTFISEKTGLNLTKLSTAEEKIVYVVSEYIGIMQRRGKYPGRTLEQLKNRGLLGSVEIAVSRATPTLGFENLTDADRKELSYEQIVVDYPDEFSPRAVWFSRKALRLTNESDSAPTATDGDTQSQTATLILHIKNAAAVNDGVIPSFTNADSAALLHMQDMSRFGRTVGNIQSRIDFACYLCGLPPLGLAADAPFEKAWAQDNREWPFPVVAMQAVAQSKVWTDEEFDQIIREIERLPSKAHYSWRDALATDEQKVKNWALSFQNSAAGPTSDTGSPAKRNPSWSRDELLLALDLYLKHRASPPGKDSSEVLELSKFLNKIGAALGTVEAETYRNANGVYMKMMNFRRFDTEYTKDGKVGLTRGNKDEEIVWNEYSGATARLAAVVAAIRAAIESPNADRELGGEDEPEIEQAEEGRVLTRVHRSRERSRKLVESKKKVALKQHGRLFCEACGFDFSIRYGSAGEGLIDVHHTKPVHTLLPGEVTKLEDLALLCANCHRVIHATRRWLSIDQLRGLIRP